MNNELEQSVGRTSLLGMLLYDWGGAARVSHGLARTFVRQTGSCPGMLDAPGGQRWRNLIIY